MLGRLHAPSAPRYAEPRLPIWWDRVVIVLTVVAILLLVVDTRLEQNTAFDEYIQGVDVALCAIFLYDFGWRLLRAENRAAFLRRNWFDLLGAIPLVGPLRAARLVRLVRLLRVLRIAALGRRIMVRHDVRLPPALRYLAVLTVAVWICAAASFYAFEREKNPGVQSLDDALWWSMTTLSTVGYGDLYPATTGGRVIALITMVLGIGVLGTLAGSLATAFMDARDRATRGTRRWVMKDHLLVLGWNDRAQEAIADFRCDPRYADTDVIVVAELERSPSEDTQLRFVRGNPTSRSVLERASADSAAAAIVLARDPHAPQSDLETAIVILTLRRLNRKARVSAELVDTSNREVLVDAGCDSAVGSSELASALLVRSVQDVGSFELVIDLLTNRGGSEFYRIALPNEYVGKSYRDYARAMLERSVSVVALARGAELFVNPDLDTKLEASHEAFVVAKTPPR